jgi:hypothetical protein
VIKALAFLDQFVVWVWPVIKYDGTRIEIGEVVGAFPMA